MDAPLNSQPAGSRDDRAMLPISDVGPPKSLSHSCHRYTESFNPDVRLHLFSVGDRLDDITAAGR